MRRTQRLLLVAVLIALCLSVSALATSTRLHVHYHEPGIRDARMVGWPMLAQLGAIIFYFADRAVALAMGSLSNSFVENGVPKTNIEKISRSFFGGDENFTAVLAAAYPIVRDMEVDEASSIIKELIAGAEDSKVHNQTSITPSLPAVDAYQMAVIQEMRDAMNMTEGAPLFNNETELHLIDIAVAPFYIDAINIISDKLFQLSTISMTEVKRRRDDDRKTAQTASALTVTCLVVFVLSLAAIAYSSRRLQQQARVRFNGAAWKLGRVLSDKECATLFRTFVIKQVRAAFRACATADVL
ncbi:MAG: hypothetical protein MHM6MM_009109 [Cercozoa sp. M6MM]